MARSPNRGSTFVPDPLWFAIVASSRADVGRHPFLIRNLGVRSQSVKCRATGLPWAGSPVKAPSNARCCTSVASYDWQSCLAGLELANALSRATFTLEWGVPTLESARE